MFTGLVTGTGVLVSLKKKGASAVLSISATMNGVEIGDSIAINGVCLTVTSIERGILSFDLSDETLRSTNLGGLRPGGKVNLEPSLRADGKLGGHIVTGHVDAVGSIKKMTKSADAIKIEISAPASIVGQLVPKGSVAVDGMSLTVVEVLKGGFTLVIIPHTAEVTTIGQKAVGSTVNIETDIIGKYVFRFLESGGGGGIMDKLREEGFLRA